MTFEKQMSKLSSEVIADMRKWHVSDAYEVGRVFDALRDAVENSRSGFTQTRVEHSKGRMPPWVALTFKGPKGQVDLTWHLSQHLGDMVDIASNRKLEKLSTSGGGMAEGLLEAWLADPSPTNRVEMSDWGINTFRADASKVPGGRDLTVQAVAIEEAQRINRARLGPTPQGLLGYLRLNRSGSEWALTRKMKVGLFLYLVAKGLIPR